MIDYITDGWTAVLLFDNKPISIYWNSRRSEGPSLYKILNTFTKECISSQIQLNEIEYIFAKNIETITAKCFGKNYECYLEDHQRYYSKFASVFNKKNNACRTLPNSDIEFYGNSERLFDWKTFLLTQEIQDIDLVEKYEKYIRSGNRPFIIIYQSYIQQRGKYEDGYLWQSSHVSPYFVIHGNHLLQAYRNLNIEPNFILKTEKINGNKIDEFTKNKVLINEIKSNYLFIEEIEIINKYV